MVDRVRIGFVKGVGCAMCIIDKLKDGEGNEEEYMLRD